MTIYFSFSHEGYRKRLSTFYPHQVIYDGRVWPTVEHAYQAAKTNSAEMQQLIMDAPTAAYAKRLGRTMLLKMSLYEWNEKRIGIMKEIIRDKLKGDHELRAWLVYQKDNIVHQAPWDEFWGDGQKGNGRNELGKIYMEIREELRDATS